MSPQAGARNDRRLVEQAQKIRLFLSLTVFQGAAGIDLALFMTRSRDSPP
jgi:hypothetical protein